MPVSPGGPVRDGDAAGRRTGRSMRGDRLVGAAARLGTGDRESRPPANGRHPGRGRLSCPTGSGRVQQGWTAVARSGRTAGPIRPATALVPASSDHWDGPSVVRRCTVTMADAGTPSGPGCEPLRRPPRPCRCRPAPSHGRLVSNGMTWSCGYRRAPGAGAVVGAARAARAQPAVRIGLIDQFARHPPCRSRFTRIGGGGLARRNRHSCVVPALRRQRPPPRGAVWRLWCTNRATLHNGHDRR